MANDNGLHYEAAGYDGMDPKRYNSRSANGRSRGESCSLATCNGCAKEINDYLHNSLQTKLAIQQAKAQKDAEDYNIHHF